MRKADSLKAFLLENVEELQGDPSRLSIFVEGGTAGATRGSMSFEYRYTCNVNILGFAGDPDNIFVPIIAWIARHQPQLLQKQDQAPFRFDAEILDSDTVDLDIHIDLTERVKVTGGQAGFTAEHLPEPEPDDSFGCGPWELWLKDMRIGLTTDPGFPGEL